MGTNRLRKESKDMLAEMAKTSEPEIMLAPDENNLYHWRGAIRGPEGTPYEGGTFQLDLNISRQYPLTPPNIRFVTKIFHPNVHAKTGEICLDILKTAWSPAWTLSSTCRAILLLLSHPEADSPLNCDAGNLLRNGDTRGFSSMARMYTNLCAMDGGGPVFANAGASSSAAR